MKKVLSLIIVITIVFSVFLTAPMTVSATETDINAVCYSSGDFDYELFDDGTAVITNYNGSASVVEIPSHIDGYPVKYLSGHSMYYCSNLTEVIIPETVIYIGEKAMQNGTLLRYGDGTTEKYYYRYHWCYGDGKVYDVDYPTQEEIARRAMELDTDYFEQVSYKEPYSLDSSNYIPGELDDKSLDRAMDYMNLYRYVAGIPSDVQVDSEYNELAQAASLVIGANRVLTHYPEKPYGMSDELYNLGAKGASSSNLGCGHRNLIHFVYSLMDDSDPSNIDRVGHRRWIINPAMSYSGFGAVSNWYGMYAFDDSRDGFFNGDYVVWPAPNTPSEMFEGAFSVSLGYDYDKPDINNLSIELTSKVSGEKYIIKNDGNSVLYVDNQGFGLPKCIIFKAPRIEENDILDVKINGVYKDSVECPIEYTVNFFSMYDLADELENVKTFTSGDFEYVETSDGSAEITGYIGQVEELVIPKTIDGKRVTKIGDSAFKDCKTLKSVVIPNGVTRIGDSAFKGCIMLRKISIPRSVDTIGVQALGYVKNQLGFENYYGFKTALLTICGENDSVAQEYADKNGFEFNVEEISTQLGDVDFDGQVSVMDATAIQLHLAVIKTLDDKALSVADVDKDGVVSVMDATQIQLFIAQLIPEL